MSQTGLLHEPIEESQYDQPQPDPWLVDVMHKVQIPEAREEREKVESPPPREDSKAAHEETKSAPTPRPSQVRFNRD